MRVKKLNVNRRHKPGEDETAGGKSEPRKWGSPTKLMREEAVSSGFNSPTDVQQQQHLHERSPLRFQTSNSSELFVDEEAAVDSEMQREEENVKEKKKAIRRAMIVRIEEMLQAMKPHAPEKVLAALPRLAQHVEKMLFKLAKTEAEYCDPATLRQRIARIQENNAKRLLAQQQQMPEQQDSGNEAVLQLKPLTEEQACVIFQHLQSWRQKLVNLYGVAPWDILPNSMLAKVALYMPLNEQELGMCGVESDKIARFGFSLVQELQRLCGPSKSANRAKVITHGRKPSSNKRGSPGLLAGGHRNKKWKNGAGTHLVTASSSSSSGSLVKSPASLLPAVDSLPTLLPTVSMMPGGVTAFTTAPSSLMATKQSQFSSTAQLSPAQASQQPFLTRLQSQEQQQQELSPPAPENHMHLLVQGAGQLRKQQNAKSFEAYEHEVQSLRWMLHQSQQEKSRLVHELEQLRSELLKRRQSSI